VLKTAEGALAAPMRNLRSGTKASFQLSVMQLQYKTRASSLRGLPQLKQGLGSHGFALYTFCSGKPPGWTSFRNAVPYCTPDVKVHTNLYGRYVALRYVTQTSKFNICTNSGLQLTERNIPEYYLVISF
jgi:hypothetical protein